MKALIQTGSSGRVPVPPEKRFLIKICGTADMLDNDRNFGQYPAVKSQECHIGRACHAQSDRRKPP